MRSHEFELFKGELKQLCATLGKVYTDALGQAYWRALEDVSLDEVQAHVERILLNATAETKFPKPASLRDKPRREALSVQDRQNYEVIQRRIGAGIDELSALEAWHMLDSYLARMDAEEDPASVFYAERFGWCKLQAKKLFEKHGQKWCVADSHCMHVASRLLGGDYIHARHNALWINP